ncbi:hypothetical protein GW17_00044828 [Ensete ventricosum]|nr:hypothetical protein GW17_00044828 [Ensete ventricosum]
MRLGTRQECVRSSLRVSGACQDDIREFAERRPRLIERLSGVAERLIGSIGKIARSTPRNRRRKTMRLAVGNAGGCRIAGVRS